MEILREAQLRQVYTRLFEMEKQVIARERQQAILLEYKLASIWMEPTRLVSPGDTYSSSSTSSKDLSLSLNTRMQRLSVALPSFFGRGAFSSASVNNAAKYSSDNSIPTTRPHSDSAADPSVPISPYLHRACVIDLEDLLEVPIPTLEDVYKALLSSNLLVPTPLLQSRTNGTSKTIPMPPLNLEPVHAIESGQKNHSRTIDTAHDEKDTFGNNALDTMKKIQNDPDVNESARSSETILSSTMSPSKQEKSSKDIHGYGQLPQKGGNVEKKVPLIAIASPIKPKTLQFAGNSSTTASNSSETVVVDGVLNAHSDAILGEETSGPIGPQNSVDSSPVTEEKKAELALINKPQYQRLLHHMRELSGEILLRCLPGHERNSEILSVLVKEIFTTCVLIPSVQAVEPHLINSQIVMMLAAQVAAPQVSSDTISVRFTDTDSRTFAGKHASVTTAVPKSDLLHTNSSAHSDTGSGNAKHFINDIDHSRSKEVRNDLSALTGVDEVSSVHSERETRYPPVSSSKNQIDRTAHSQAKSHIQETMRDTIDCHLMGSARPMHRVFNPSGTIDTHLTNLNTIQQTPRMHPMSPSLTASRGYPASPALNSRAIVNETYFAESQKKDKRIDTGSHSHSLSYPYRTAVDSGDKWLRSDRNDHSVSFALQGAAPCTSSDSLPARTPHRTVSGPMSVSFLDTIDPTAYDSVHRTQSRQGDEIGREEELMEPPMPTMWRVKWTDLALAANSAAEYANKYKGILFPHTVPTSTAERNEKNKPKDNSSPLLLSFSEQGDLRGLLFADTTPAFTIEIGRPHVRHSSTPGTSFDSNAKVYYTLTIRRKFEHSSGVIELAWKQHVRYSCLHQLHDDLKNTSMSNIPFPQKRAFWKSGHYSAEFLDERRKGLQKWVDILCCFANVLRSKPVQDFFAPTSQTTITVIHSLPVAQNYAGTCRLVRAVFGIPELADLPPRSLKLESPSPAKLSIRAKPINAPANPCDSPNGSDADAVGQNESYPLLPAQDRSLSDSHSYDPNMSFESHFSSQADHLSIHDLHDEVYPHIQDTSKSFTSSVILIRRKFSQNLSDPSAFSYMSAIPIEEESLTLESLCKYAMLLSPLFSECPFFQLDTAWNCFIDCPAIHSKLLTYLASTSVPSSLLEEVIEILTNTAVLSNSRDPSNSPSHRLEEGITGTQKTEVPNNEIDPSETAHAITRFDRIERRQGSVILTDSISLYSRSSISLESTGPQQSSKPSNSSGDPFATEIPRRLSDFKRSPIPRVPRSCSIGSAQRYKQRESASSSYPGNGRTASPLSVIHFFKLLRSLLLLLPSGSTRYAQLSPSTLVWFQPGRVYRQPRHTSSISIATAQKADQPSGATIGSEDKQAADPLRRIPPRARNTHGVLYAVRFASVEGDISLSPSQWKDLERNLLRWNSLIIEQSPYGSIDANEAERLDVPLLKANVEELDNSALEKRVSKALARLEVLFFNYIADPKQSCPLHSMMNNSRLSSALRRQRHRSTPSNRGNSYSVRRNLRFQFGNGRSDSNPLSKSAALPSQWRNWAENSHISSHSGRKNGDFPRAINDRSLSSSEAIVGMQANKGTNSSVNENAANSGKRQGNPLLGISVSMSHIMPQLIQGSQQVRRRPGVSNPQPSTGASTFVQKQGQVAKSVSSTLSLPPRVNLAPATPGLTAISSRDDELATIAQGRKNPEHWLSHEHEIGNHYKQRSNTPSDPAVVPSTPKLQSQRQPQSVPPVSSLPQRRLSPHRSVQSGSTSNPTSMGGNVTMPPVDAILTAKQLNKAEFRMFNLLDELFGIEKDRSWIKRQVIRTARAAFKLLFHSTAYQKIESLYKQIIDPTSIASVLYQLRDGILWPKGIWAPAAPPVPLEEKVLACKEAKAMLLQGPPAALVSFLGRESLDDGIVRVHEFVQYPVLIQSLILCILDVFVSKLFPDAKIKPSINMEQFTKLLESSERNKPAMRQFARHTKEAKSTLQEILEKFAEESKKGDNSGTHGNASIVEDFATMLKKLPSLGISNHKSSHSHFSESRSGPNPGKFHDGLNAPPKSGPENGRLGKESWTFKMLRSMDDLLFSGSHQKAPPK